MMALKATATKETRKAVCRTLGMASPILVFEIPNQPNIKYVVRSSPDTLEEAFAPLVEKIRHQRANVDHMIVYCHTYDSCSMIYLFLKSRLQIEMTEPIGARDLARYRLVDMFTACTTPAMKEAILLSFCNGSGILRIVIAFGMGLDCPNMQHIIHWGPLTDIEQYMYVIWSHLKMEVYVYPTINVVMCARFYVCVHHVLTLISYYNHVYHVLTSVHEYHIKITVAGEIIIMMCM